MYADVEAFNTQLRASGAATEQTLQRIASGWRDWAADEDGWLSILHGEVLCRA